MTSPLQIVANQANAQHSTGPRTEEGKSKVALNGVDHGLSIRRHVVLPGESQAEFDHLLNRYRVEQFPGCAIERSLIERLAQTQWRIYRCDRFEIRLMSESGLAAEDFFEKHGDVLERHERYANSHRREYSRILRDFLAARRSRRQDAQAGLFTGPCFPDPDFPPPEPKPEPAPEPPADPPAAAPETAPDKANPIPEANSRKVSYAYANELVGLKRMHPKFDPRYNKRLMSEGLLSFLKDPGNMANALDLLKDAYTGR